MATNTPDTPRRPRPISEASLEERQMRMDVFTMDRQTVLIEILAMAPLPGLPMKARNDALLDLSHALEGQARGLDFNAYRSKPDTGFCLYRKESVVSIRGLLEQLEARGLFYVGGHWQMVEGKGPKSVLNFSSVGEPVPMPISVQKAMDSTYNHGTVWCNKRDAENGTQVRKDVLVLAKQLKSDDPRPARQFMITGNTYRLV